MKIILLFLSIFTQNIFCFNLAIDIGHNNKNFGALSSTCNKEYIYNSQLAEFIINNSENIITSNIKKENITFNDRYLLSKNKDLFVSLHHDSVNPKYIIYDKNNCPQTNYAEGYSIFVSKKNLQYEKSLMYARIFANSLKELGLKPSLHHSELIKGENKELVDKELGIYIFDDLKVLKNSYSPAFLFEAGVIVNRKEEAIIKTLVFKEKILKAFNSLKSY